MSLTKVTPAVIAVTNNITSNTFGSANTIPSFQIDGSGVIVAASNTAISLSANSVANSSFQTGSIENYMRAQGTSSVFAGMRNRIINGAMVIDQRNYGSSGTANDYTVDRWAYYGSQSAKATWQQDSSANTAAGFTSSLKITSSSSYSVGSSDIFFVYQGIEGYNIADLAWGTANAKTVTLSFWVRSSLTGTFGGAIQGGGTYSYPFTYTISAANTWEQKFITITGPTSGTWAKTTSLGALVRFGLGVGSTYSTTAGSWASGDYYSATGATSVVGTSGATWYVTGVQFEAGSTATPFEHRNYGQELNLCLRYFVTYVKGNGESMGMCSSWTTSSFWCQGRAPLPMRTAPTGSVATASSGYSFYFAGTQYLNDTLDFTWSSDGNANNQGFLLFRSSGWSPSSTGSAGFAGGAQTNASGAKVTLSAEF